MKTKINTTNEAIEAIVFLKTLPSQIDYITSEWRIRKENAEEFLNLLSKDEKKLAYVEIDRQISNYYSPIEGCDYSPAELDDMF